MLHVGVVLKGEPVWACVRVIFRVLSEFVSVLLLGLISLSVPPTERNPNDALLTVLHCRDGYWRVS